MNNPYRTQTNNTAPSAEETYAPSPLSTYGIELPESLLDMIELVAEHNHNVWAEQRIKDGWVHGPHRDDDQKTHPCLVPYCDLPEGEKDYDRKTAIGVLLVVVKLGYRIEKPLIGTETNEASRSAFESCPE